MSKKNPELLGEIIRDIAEDGSLGTSEAIKTAFDEGFRSYFEELKRIGGNNLPKEEEAKYVRGVLNNLESKYPKHVSIARVVIATILKTEGQLREAEAVDLPVTAPSALEADTRDLVHPWEKARLA